MDKRSRAYKILQAGLSNCEHDASDADSIDDYELLESIALMIDYATKKPAKKAKPKLLYNEVDVLGVLNYDLTISRYGSLNRVLQNMVLRPDDLEVFEVWFRDSMYPWMQANNVALTFSMLARKYPEWLERARSNTQFSSTAPEVVWK